MNTLIKELPALYFEGKAKDADQVVGEFSSSFFQFQVHLPDIMPEIEEMTDGDLLMAAQAAGTFRFLDDEAENKYRL